MGLVEVSTNFVGDVVGDGYGGVELGFSEGKWVAEIVAGGVGVVIGGIDEVGGLWLVLVVVVEGARLAKCAGGDL